MALCLNKIRHKMKNRFKNFINTMMNDDSKKKQPENQPEEQLSTDGPLVDEVSPSPEQLLEEEQKKDGWEAKFNDINDRYLRLYSEFDNYKKRTSKERIEFAKTAAADIFAAILPVLDDFDRAAKATEQSTATLDSVKEGMQLVHQKLKSLLVSRGLEEMDAQGQVFDADLHEAITQIPAPTDDMKGKVLDLVEKGYALNGKVIRYAKVVVGS
jgi:molecular chaperone GrpE